MQLVDFGHGIVLEGARCGKKLSVKREHVVRIDKYFSSLRGSSRESGSMRKPEVAFPPKLAPAISSSVSPQTQARRRQFQF